MSRCDLGRELHLGQLVRHLAPVVKLDDPHARTFAYRRAGAGPVHTRDDIAAAAIARARRRAFSPLSSTSSPMILSAAPQPCPDPIPDDLVERMAEGLAFAAAIREVDLGDGRSVHDWLLGARFHPVQVAKAEVVEPAIERAREKLPRLLEGAAAKSRGVLAGLGDVVGLVALLVGWAAAYCAFCPPAQAATGAVLTDEGLAHLTPALIVLVSIVLVLGAATFWRLSVRPSADPVDGDDYPGRHWPAPPMFDEPVDIATRRRRADRG